MGEDLGSETGPDHKETDARENADRPLQGSRSILNVRVVPECNAEPKRARCDDVTETNLMQRNGTQCDATYASWPLISSFLVRCSIPEKT